MTNTDRFERPAPVGALLLLALLVLSWGLDSWWPNTVDDAFITFRHARNLVSGHGPLFNPGERVEGYTSPSWMLGSALALKLKLDPIRASKWIGVVSSLGLLGLLGWALTRSGVRPRGAALATLLLASSFVLHIWSVAGLETNAFALLLFAGVLALGIGSPGRRSTLVASALLTAAALTRPEGLAYWGLGLVLVAIPALRQGRRWNLIGRYALPGLVLLAHLAWRWSYYGDPLPNTYYVKTGGGIEMWRQGLVGLRLFLSEPSHLLWIVAAIAGLLSVVTAHRSRKPAAIMAGLVGLHLLYVVSVGDDGLRVHRFYVPILAPLAYLAGLSFAGNSRGALSRTLRVAAALAILLAVPLAVWAADTRHLSAMRRGSQVYLEGNLKLGHWFAENVPRDTLVAVAAAGAIPYVSGLPAIDMYGLTDRRIAHGPFPAREGGRMMKWDSAYVLSRRPEWIVINRGYFRAHDTRAEAIRRNPASLAVAPMDRDLFRAVSADGAYRLRTIRFEDGSSFHLFQRASASAPRAAAPSRLLSPSDHRRGRLHTPAASRPDASVIVQVTTAL